MNTRLIIRMPYLGRTASPPSGSQSAKVSNRRSRGPNEPQPHLRLTLLLLVIHHIDRLLHVAKHNVTVTIVSLHPAHRQHARPAPRHRDRKLTYSFPFSSRSPLSLTKTASSSSSRTRSSGSDTCVDSSPASAIVEAVGLMGGGRGLARYLSVRWTAVAFSEFGFAREDRS